MDFVDFMRFHEISWIPRTEDLVAFANEVLPLEGFGGLFKRGPAPREIFARSYLFAIASIFMIFMIIMDFIDFMRFHWIS